jgi:hypothetical protein
MKVALFYTKNRSESTESSTFLHENRSESSTFLHHFIPSPQHRNLHPK